MKKIAIVGGGATGLSVAWFLKDQMPDVEIDLFEADRKGGYVQTELHEGAILESGPFCFLVEDPLLEYMSNKLGLSDELIKAKRESFAYMKDGYYQKASGFLQFENHMFSFGGSSGFSSFFSGKKKVSVHPGMSFFDAIKSLYGEPYAETQGAVYSRLAFGFEPEEITFKTALPELYELLRAGKELKSALKELGAQKEEFWGKELAGASIHPGFYTFRDGLESWIDAVYHQLKDAPKPVTFHFNKVQHLLPGNNQSSLSAGHKKFGPYDKIILAIPASAQALLWKDADKELSKMFHEIESRPINTVYAAWDEKNFKGAGSGIFASRKEKLASFGVYFMNQFFSHEAPPGVQLTRSVLPGDLSMFSEDDLVDIVIKDIRKILGDPGTPKWYKVYRHQHAVARLDSASYEKVAAALSWQKNYPAVISAGHENARPGLGGILAFAYKTAREISGG